jgi:hypothetical protein
MPEHDFGALFEKYPEVLDQMPETFTSHEFIQRLAQRNQALYIKALYAYRNTGAPFRAVHAILAKELHRYREHVQDLGNVDSEDIFGDTVECAEWQKKGAPTASTTPSGRVAIGDVTGGIQGSIIAGRDVTTGAFSPAVAVGAHLVSTGEPTAAELGQLLAEIQKGLAEIVAQQEALKAISPAAPFTAQGAEQSVKDVAAKVNKGDVKPEEAKSMQESLREATGLLSGILDGAKTVAKKTGEVVGAVAPLAEKLKPVVEMLGTAAMLVAKLWLLK